jgi:uncharacterized membrane protein YadS
LAPFFAYYSLVSSLIHKSKQKNKNTNILAPKFVIFLFVYIFSVFFPPKKIPPKARVRTTQSKNATSE